MARPLRSHRFLSGGLLLGLVGVALALTTQSAAASSGVCMGVVIDYGTKTPPFSSGAPPAAVAQSASVTPDSTSDEQALVAAGDTVDPNSSGLICAINSYPVNADQNCLHSENGSFYYWSYWQGDPFTNTWTYASQGPASHDVASGSTYVEGWRYQDPGADNPNATKPSISPANAFAAACPGVTPVSDAKKTTPPPGNVTTTTAPSGSASTPTTAVPGGGGSPAPTSSSSRTGITTTTKAGTGPTTTSPSTSSTTTTTTPAAAASGQTHHLASASGPLNHKSGGAGGSGDGGSTWPIVLVLVVVALLGAVALIRWRRGPATQE